MSEDKVVTTIFALGSPVCPSGLGVPAVMHGVIVPVQKVDPIAPGTYGDNWPFRVTFLPISGLQAAGTLTPGRGLSV